MCVPPVQPGRRQRVTVAPLPVSRAARRRARVHLHRGGATNSLRSGAERHAYEHGGLGVDPASLAAPLPKLVTGQPWQINDCTHRRGETGTAGLSISTSTSLSRTRCGVLWRGFFLQAMQRRDVDALSFGSRQAWLHKRLTAAQYVCPHRASCGVCERRPRRVIEKMLRPEMRRLATPRAPTRRRSRSTSAITTSGTKRRRMAPAPLLRVKSEDFFRAPEEEVQRVFDFLGLARATSRSKPSRRTM